ncbi:LOW QUALITY PROTEIN: protein HHL1, chloroplastic [Herrania umbratica]|uniref:LOW QUALITY PROTEIN: protein HHL1, chloroplastic n=1 Tax=Herrania umbratica TaxID=108875 RepID=A0A6J1B2H9_9ROSI|nr:LOW QUALITY PROTEIN: protein HHL1, chloroplastic [Herrania umbratica]
MEVGMSLNALVRLPLSSTSRTHHESLDGLVKHSLFSSRTTTWQQQSQRRQQRGGMLVVEAKGKKGMAARQFQRPPPPPMPKIEDDGNPRFVIFIRMAGVNLWYPLSLITGGTTAKIMVAAKDNFLGKYIYKDTLARNLAAVIYRDEKEIQKTAFKQFRVLQSATDFRYGYKLVENGNVRSALSTNDVIELPTQDQLKTVLDKVKDFFGDAKDSFGKITALNSGSDEESEKKLQKKPRLEVEDRLAI